MPTDWRGPTFHLGLLSCGPALRRRNPCNEAPSEGMSAVPTDISLVAEPGSGRNETLPRNARIYFVLVATATAAATLPFLGRLQNTHDWLAFFILGSAAAVAQLFVVRTPRDQAYHTAIVFLIAAAFLLPPELVALMGIVQHVPEWLKMRYRWYLQTFNICNYVLGSMAVWFLAHHILRWQTNPWLIPFAVAPLILVHRSLAVPQLQAEARVDPKTGLFNARHFAAALSEEIGRAQRFERPMSLIMADLDLLRDINNSYGHLAGDAVLKGIAEVFRG